MTPDMALSLEPGDVCFASQHILWVRAVVPHGFYHPGVEIYLNAGTIDMILAPQDVELLYRKDDVPPGFGSGMHQAADVAEAERIVAARKAERRQRF